MKISWAKTTPVILKSAIKVIKMEDSSGDDEEVISMKSHVMVERDERVREVEEPFHGLKDLVHIYQNAVRDRIQGAGSLVQMLGYEQVSLKNASDHGSVLKRKHKDLRLWEQERKVQRSDVGEDWVKEEVLGCLVGIEDEMLGHNEDLKVKSDLSSDRCKQLTEMIELASEEVKSLELGLGINDFDMYGLFRMGRRTVERMQRKKSKESDESRGAEEEQRSSVGGGGSIGSVIESGGTAGYDRGHLVEERMKRVSPLCGGSEVKDRFASHWRG
jgi:hypothetical protein